MMCDFDPDRSRNRPHNNKENNRMWPISNIVCYGDADLILVDVRRNPVHSNEACGEGVKDPGTAIFHTKCFTNYSIISTCR